MACPGFATVAAHHIDLAMEILRHFFPKVTIAAADQQNFTAIVHKLVDESAVIFRNHPNPLSRIEEGPIKVSCDNFVKCHRFNILH